MDAWPRWEDPLSTTQNTRRAEAYGSMAMTWSTSRSNGTIPVCSSHRPNTRARWTSHAARYCRAPARSYSCSTRMTRAAAGGRVRVTPAPRLDGGLLVRGDHEVRLVQRFSLPPAGVQVEDPSRLSLEVRVPGKEPAAVGPGADGVFVEPPPDGRSGDLGHDPPVKDLRPDLRDGEPGQRNPQSGGELTGQRLDLDHHAGGERPQAVPAGAARQGRPGVPRRTACAIWTRPAGEGRAGRRSVHWSSPGLRTARSWPEPRPDTVTHTAQRSPPREAAPPATAR